MRVVAPQLDAATGEFRCQFYRGGRAQLVVVDDRVPFFTHSSLPVRSRRRAARSLTRLQVFADTTSRNEQWVALVEKA